MKKKSKINQTTLKNILSYDSNRGIHKNNKSGYKGVTFSNGKWTSCVAFNKKRFRLGIFETAEEAYKAYLIKSKEVQKEFSKYE